MYRSIKLYEQIKDSDSKIFPICVPSYNRPKPKIIRSLEEYPELPIILFIRNTKEQKKLYSGLRNKCKIVTLNNVHNIGQTRRAIVDWCVKNKISNVFMFDDDINEVDYLYPYNLNGTLCMRSSRLNKSDDKKTERGKKLITPYSLRMWIKLIKSSNKNLTLSSPNYRTTSWHIKNANPDIVYNSASCIQCVHINIKNLYKYKINYRDTEICGNEDIALQFDIMSKGLLTCIFKDLVYDCPAVGSLPGGCENASGIYDIRKRYVYYTNLFLKNVSGENHPGIKIKKSNSKIKIDSIKFNWKYWTKLVEEQYSEKTKL